MLRLCISVYSILLEIRWRLYLILSQNIFQLMLRLFMKYKNLLLKFSLLLIQSHKLLSQSFVFTLMDRWLFFYGFHWYLCWFFNLNRYLMTWVYIWRSFNSKTIFWLWCFSSIFFMNLFLCLVRIIIYCCWLSCLFLIFWWRWVVSFFEQWGF